MWQRLLNRLLPQDCQLCGKPDVGDMLCVPCMADLPRLPVEHCPLCALPTPAGAVCGGCLRHPPHFDATHASLVYAFPVDQLVQAFKYGHQLALSRLFARLMRAGQAFSADIMIPLPLSKQRLRERGFNQAVEIARPLAQASGLALDLHAMARVVDTAAQAGLPWNERRANIRHAFECKANLAGKSIVVIDDVMTSGATLDEFARTLKLHGAARVTNWVLARTLKNP
ncbi:MAG: ComF family protein [Georgfuchsia sp.]